MTGGARLQGWPELKARIGKIPEGMQYHIQRALDETGLELRGDVVKAIHRSPATGRTYTRRGVTHRASAPGEPPASDSGRLANSVTFKNESRLSVSVGSDVVYAGYLEFGTRRMAPRPVWRPAVEAMRSKFERRLRDAIIRAMKG